MIIQPISLAAANSMVVQWHRHSGQVRGHRFSLGLFDELGPLLGVVIVGRPVSRVLDNGSTVEITRLTTDGTRNACSMLYAAACHEARRRGFSLCVTYTLATETGASLRAAGFTHVADVTPRQWDAPSRPRSRRTPVPRHRWERKL